jgi:hypothetical protein
LLSLLCLCDLIANGMFYLGRYCGWFLAAY